MTDRWPAPPDLLTPHERAARGAAQYGAMVVVATHQARGRLYLCACGARTWSCFGHAERHARTCGRADETP